MLTKFWEGIGEQLAGRWSATMVVPALVFWGYGLLTWIFHTGWTNALSQIQKTSEATWWVMIVAGLAIVLFSSFVVQSLVLPMLRLLEGYLPDWLSFVRTTLIQRQRRRIEQLQQLYTRIAESGVDQSLTHAQREQLARLDEQLRQAPSHPDDIMPTRLGNLLRAAEQRPLDKYGLNAIICWARLWLLLPEAARQELSAARSSLDMNVQVTIWGGLIIIWALVWGWWSSVIWGLVWALWSSVVTIVVIWISYRRALSAATVYGDFLESAFDLYRTRLYDALRLPKPTTPGEELAMGNLVTKYLYRGVIPETVVFTHKQEE